MSGAIQNGVVTMHTDIAIIGAGAAGLAAAASAYDAGVHDVVVFDREDAPGGILKQCIHNGFGLHRYKEELSGPEYAHREYMEVLKRGISVHYQATVLSIEPQNMLRVISPELGMVHVQAKAIILAMGSRERTRGALCIPGTRPAGVYTAGTVQRMINLDGIIPGKEIVMLGSGDIGLIVARRLAYEGAHVKMVLNRSHFSGGLRRNIVQCLDDYGIPLRLLHTVTNIYGRERIEAVGVSEVDKATKQAIPGTEERIECDTLIFSVGLIPENDLARAAGIKLDRGSRGAVVDNQYQTSVPGIFSCGNVLHVHDLVDFVSDEGERAGRAAARYVLESDGGIKEDRDLGLNTGGVQPHTSDEGKGSCAEKQTYAQVVPGTGVSYVVPQQVAWDVRDKLLMRFRVRDIYRKATICVLADGEQVKAFKRPILIPAEMVEIQLDPGVFNGHTSVTIQIEAGED